jgi:lipid II:glycine glycyltransferase (peptidoglycan interpeptide bridge formation enzyme)
MLQAVDLEVIHLRDYIAVNVAPSEEDQMTSYASRNRNTLRKAVREGVVVKSSDDFSVFVSLYLENMRQLNAAPLYFFSEAFFDHLAQLSRNHGCVLVAEHLGKAVGAAVFLYSGPYGHYYLASANPAGRALGAGNLLLHEGINRCRESGVRRVHLGGGLTGAADDPLLAFKKSFSPATVPYHIGRRIHDAESYRRLVQGWEKRHPDLVAKYAGQLQCYRQTS